MEKFKNSSFRIPINLIGLLLIISFILLFLWWQAGRWYENRIVIEKKTQSTIDLAQHANVLTTSINRRFALLEGLYAFSLTNPDIEKLNTNFDTFASGLYVSVKGIRNFVIAPGGINKFVYPIERNETVYDHDQINDYRPNVRTDVQKAINTRQIVLSGPYELRQGGLGLVARRAVFIKDEFWGLISMVLDMKPVIASANFETCNFKNYVIGIRDDEGNVFYGEQQAFSNLSTTQIIELPDGYWEIAHTPVGGWNKTVHNEVLGFKIIGLIVVVLITLLMYLLFSRQYSLTNLVRERTRELSDSEKKFRSLTANIPNLVYRTKNDKNWTAVYVNDFIEKLVGYQASDFIGNKTRSLLSIIHPKDIKMVDSIVNKALDNREIFELEYRLVHKNGDLVWVHEKGSGVYDNKGDLLWLDGITSNITERKQTEKELEKYHEQLEKIVQERTDKLEKSQQSLALLLKDVNESRDELYKSNKELEDNTKSLEKSRKSLALLLEDVNESRAELDISNRKLEASNKELEAFSYSVSHDLRAPLRAIDGFTAILMEDYASILDVEGKRLGSIIQQNAKKMGQLIDDLLIFSRMGRKSLKLTIIDMENMVKAIYNEITTPEERKQITFTVANIPKVQGDSNMMHQVWMNLISNAVKFSSNRKKIVISVSYQEEKNKLIYYIKDNGAGFNMKYKDKLFGVFQRLHNEKEFTGTGVGLALVQRIINRHDGEIWAEGEVDEGAIFYLSLPKNVS